MNSTQFYSFGRRTCQSWLCLSAQSLPICSEPTPLMRPPDDEREEQMPRNALIQNRSTKRRRVTSAKTDHAMKMQLAAALAVVLTTSVAMAQASRPDPAVTPGSVNANVTQFTIATTICSPGWARSVRPPRKITSYLKRRQLAGLGYPDQRMRVYEEDHLIPLSLGGAPADRRNLWPEPRQPNDGWTAERKDQLEDKLHRMVCGGELSLRTAQWAIASNWTAAYARYVEGSGD